MAKDETTDQSQQQDAPTSEHPDPGETVDTNAGDDAVMGTVADQPDGTEDDKNDEKK